MTKSSSARTRRDRWSDWAVVAVLVLALALGWGVMAFAQGQHETFTDATSGLTVDYPRGWLVKGTDSLAFQVLDPVAADFKTTYQVRAWPISASEALTSSLGAILSDASLSRAQEGTAYRLLDIREGRAIRGQPTMEAEYVYVVEGNDLFVQQLPVIVRGLDVAMAGGDRAFVFSLLAGRDNFNRSEPGFRDFVESAKVGP
jgi:hypothetical protein